MTTQLRTKWIREGDMVAEVDVAMIDEPQGWEPYLSLNDARKLDRVHSALRRGDMREAATMGRIYRLTPVNAA